uniref:Ig-like domain-containing protein n=1 Tax=Sarcophilus harrisii TaxID=9305 RepID=A0A7N4PM94_SARHA
MMSGLTPPSALLLISALSLGSQTRGLQLSPVPPSVTVPVGGTARLPCQHNGGRNATVTWWRIGLSKLFREPVERQPLPNGTLVVGGVSKSDGGMYQCRVSIGNRLQQESCGTYLRVRDPIPRPFLDMGEATKNRIITAEGIILLFCAVVPGTFLLFRELGERDPWPLPAFKSHGPGTMGLAPPPPPARLTPHFSPLQKLAEP